MVPFPVRCEQPGADQRMRVNGGSARKMDSTGRGSVTAEFLESEGVLFARHGRMAIAIRSSRRFCSGAVILWKSSYLRICLFCERQQPVLGLRAVARCMMTPKSMS